MSITPSESPALRSASRRNTAEYLAYALIGAFLLLFFAAAVTGPDFERYLGWARAFEAGDAAAFWDHSATLSPLGVPLTQWSHGPGLIFAAVCPAGCRALISMDRQGMIAGLLFTALMWWALFKLLLRAGTGDVQWAVYGIALAILGTHLGFYARSIASETFSQATLALLAMWTVTRARWRPLDALVVGCLAALLMVSRSQLLIYTLPFLGVMYWSAWRTTPDRKPLRMALFVGLSLLPLGIALIEVGLTNRWMTGSVLGSPYSFGDGAFRSLDFARPELGAVLLHPWHGLLTHHPLYAVGFAALIVLIVRVRSLPERIFWLSCAIVIVLHVYLQAAWYVWWLGKQTFGMRGLGVSAVILVPALVYLMRGRELRGQRYGVWAAAALVSCLWSAPLFLENLTAETQFLTYGALFGRYGALVRPLVAPFALIAGMTLLAYLISRNSAVATGLGGRFATQMRIRPALAISLMLLIPLALYCLIVYVAGQAVALISIPLSAAYTFIFLSVSAEPTAEETIYAPTRRPVAEAVVAMGLIALFGISTALFARLARHTEAQIAAHALPAEEVLYVSAVHVDEVMESYWEYLDAPGFEAKKAALKEYALKLRACATIPSQDMVAPRVMGPPHREMAMNVPFGDDLWLTGVGLVGGEGEAGRTFRAGELLGVQTRWEVVNPMLPKKFSLRIEDGVGGRWAADYVPQVGCGEETWQPGRDQIDRGGIHLPPDLPPGPYTLKLVVYDPATGAALPVEGGEVVALGNVDVIR